MGRGWGERQRDHRAGQAGDAQDAQLQTRKRSKKNRGRQDAKGRDSGREQATARAGRGGVCQREEEETVGTGTERGSEARGGKVLTSQRGSPGV